MKFNSGGVMNKILFPILVLWALVMFGCSGDEDNGNGPPPVEEPTRLVVDTTVTAPSLTSVDEAVWFQVDSTEVTIGESTTYSKNPVLGERSVWMKAILKDSTLYIWAKWRDGSADIKANYIRCTDTFYNSWEIVTFIGQDVFSIMFDAQNNGDEGADCASMCHIPYMKTTGGGNADVWKWSSTAARPSNLAEDKWITSDSSAEDLESDIFYLKEMFITNFDPRLINPLPRFKHVDTIDFTGIVLYRDEASTFDPINDNLDIPWPLGYEMPGYVVDSSIFNDPDRTNRSWHDVRAISKYDSTGLNSSDYSWTIVFERPLNTDYTDDVDLSNLDSVQVTIAVTNSSRVDTHVDHSGSEPFYLILKP
jgi:hypothetical protein